MKNVIHTSTPDDPYDIEIVIPRDMDLPFSVRLYAPADPFICDVIKRDPYNTAGNEFVFEIFTDQESTTPLVEFLNAVWTTSESEGQDGTPVNDIVSHTFLASELTALTKGQEYWCRFRGTDADGVDYLIGRGTFLVERY